MFNITKHDTAIFGGYIDGYWNEIENLRMLKNLTQEELAERTDLTKGYISQIESQHASPSMETFLNILEVLGTRPSDFSGEN